jgi:hypothetical protein
MLFRINMLKTSKASFDKMIVEKTAMPLNLTKEDRAGHSIYFCASCNLVIFKNLNKTDICKKFKITYSLVDEYCKLVKGIISRD